MSSWCSCLPRVEEDCGIPVEAPLFGVQVWEWEWMPGRKKDPKSWLCPWPVSGGVIRVAPWPLGERYWSNSWTSNPSMVLMTSVLNSEMST